MATIIVPYTEVEKLIKLCLEAYNVRSGLVIERTDIEYKFLQPRAGTQQCIEIKDKAGVTPSRNFRARYYIENYRNVGSISNFRLEEFQGQSLGLGTEAFISYATLPRTFFPTLSKIYGIPVMEDTDEDIEISVSFDNATTFEDNSDVSVGFNPTTYSVTQIPNNFTLSVAVNKSPPEPLGVEANTVDGTAMAPIDYETVSLSPEWQARDTADKLVPITLHGDTGYYNWFGKDDETQRMFEGTGTPDPETMPLLELQDQNRRIYSPSYSFPEWDNLLGWFELHSQYLEEKALYYEFEIASPGKEINIFINRCQGKRTFLDNNGEGAVTEYSGIRVLGNVYAEPTSFFVFEYSQVNKVYNQYENSSVVLDGESNEYPFPLRVGFLVDPEFGVKIHIGGNWINYDSQLTPVIEEAMPFPYYVQGYDETYLHRHWFTVKGRKANFTNGVFEEYNDGLLDVKAIVDIDDAEYLPVGYELYTGIKYPFANRSFTAVLSNPDNTSITQNTATINLVNKSQFCYNKLITNHNFTGLRTDAEVIKPSYYPPTVPVVRWTETSVQCGIYLNMPEFELGNDLNIISIDVDAQSLPLILKPGDAVVYSFRESEILYPSSLLSFNDISPFYNGTYVKNSDGTRTFTGLFRFYEKINGELELWPVPITNNDLINAEPPLFLHFTSADMEYTDTGEIYVQFGIPTIKVQGNSVGEKPIKELKIYYTLDGEEPTTDSDSFDPYAEGFYILLNIEDGLTTVKMFAAAPGYVDSPVISGVFGGAALQTDSPDVSVTFDDTPLVDTSEVVFYFRGDLDLQTLLQRYKVTLTPQTETTEIKAGFVSSYIYSYNFRLYDRVLTSYSEPFDLTGFVVPEEYHDINSEYYTTILCHAQDTDMSGAAGTEWFAPVRDSVLTCTIHWFNLSFYNGGQTDIFEYSSGQVDNDWNLDVEITGPLVDYGGEEDYYRIFYFMYDFQNIIDYDDWRYFEIHIGDLNGTTTDFAINFAYYTDDGTRYCLYKRNGALVFTNGDPTVSTSRPWGQNDIIRVQYNLKNAQFRLAINSGLWSSTFGGVPKFTYTNTIGFYAAVGSDPDDENDIIGSKVSFRQRDVGFTYPLPPGTVPLDNLPESLL